MTAFNQCCHEQLFWVKGYSYLVSKCRFPYKSRANKGKMVLSGNLMHKGFVIIIIETFFSLLTMSGKIPHLMNARRMLDNENNKV